MEIWAIYMVSLDETLSSLPQCHRAALQWFQQRRGDKIGWPEPMADGVFLVNRPKGIHKPASWRYTLSVRQALGGSYPDREPEKIRDGS
jgi:putative restriction endonuclease